jgi:hypothetical protein
MRVEFKLIKCFYHIYQPYHYDGYRKFMPMVMVNMVKVVKDWIDLAKKLEPNLSDYYEKS